VPVGENVGFHHDRFADGALDGIPAGVHFGLDAFNHDALSPRG